MRSRIVIAVTASLALPLSAQVASVNPQRPGIKWDSMDLGPFFSGSYRVGETVTCKGIAVAVGTKETPATMLFDTELMRFVAAWEGGLAKFTRGRGGLEDVIAADGSANFATGWTTGIGAEIKQDPRERHQGALEGAKFNGIHANGASTVLSYTVGRQAVLESPGSSVKDGIRVYTRTFTIGAGADVKQILAMENAGEGVPTAAGTAVLVRDGKATCVVLRGAPTGAKLVAKDQRLIVETGAIRQPVTFQIAFCIVPAADAEKLVTTLRVKTAPASLHALTRAGAARWGAPLTSAGRLGDDAQAYVADEIPFPEDDPFQSWFCPGGHDFFPDGTLAVVNLSGDVWIVSGLDDKLGAVKWKRFASGLFQPLGCKVVDGKIYVLGRDRITRLHDTNDDGEADYYENFNSDCVVTHNHHEFALDLQTDSKGNFYFAKGSPWTPTNQSKHQGTMLRVSRDGATLDVFATGLRAPNGLGMGPGDILSCSDNEGHWMPANRLNIVKQGGFYGMVPAAHREMTFKTADGREFKANPSLESARQQHKTEFWGNASSPVPIEGHDAPLVWLPMDIDNSPGGGVWVPAGNKWGPWGGRMLHMSYGKCTLMGVMSETVEGVAQGGVVKFPLKFNSGIQRGRFSPKDGQLYLTGLSVWQSSALRDGCLYRVRYTGRPVTMPVGLATKANGVEIQFSAPLGEGAGETAGWFAEQWNYRWTGAYGSPDISIADPGKVGKDIVFVEKATVSADKKSVLLQLADRAPAHTLRLKCNIKAADGSSVKYQIDQTINRLPGGKTAGVPR